MDRFGKEEEQALLDVIRNSDKTLSFYSFSYKGGGGQVHVFEKEFVKWLGRKYCVAVNSGTSALFVAIKALRYDIDNRSFEKRDIRRMISIPSYTFVADAEAVLANNCQPYFEDINPQTYCMDTLSRTDYGLNGIYHHPIEPWATIAIPVHTLGNIVHPNLIKDSQDIGVRVIEDCAQCVGGSWKGKKAGTFGDIAIFSGQGTKNLGCGEGGWLCMDDEELYERCCAIRNHGDYYKYKFPNKKYPYLQNILGYNLRMTEMQAAVARCQLKKLPSFLKEFKRNAELIFDLLPDGIDPPYIPKEVEHAYFILGCKWKGDVRSKEKFLQRLLLARRKAGLLWSEKTPDIPGSNSPPGYTIGGGYSSPLYQLPLYHQYRRSCPNTEEVIRGALWIDIHRFSEESRVLKEMELFQKVYQTIS